MNIPNKMNVLVWRVTVIAVALVGLACAKKNGTPEAELDPIAAQNAAIEAKCPNPIKLEDSANSISLSDLEIEVAKGQLKLTQANLYAKYEKEMAGAFAATVKVAKLEKVAARVDCQSLNDAYSYSTNFSIAALFNFESNRIEKNLDSDFKFSGNEVQSRYSRLNSTYEQIPDEIDLENDANKAKDDNIILATKWYKISETVFEMRTKIFSAEKGISLYSSGTYKLDKKTD